MDITSVAIAVAQIGVHYRTLLDADNANRFQHIERMKQTQIAAVRPMDDFDPILLDRQRAQENHPEVSQRRRDHQARQADRIRQMTLVQMKATALLVREQGLNGTITNDKFCMSRTTRLHRTWWRRPLKSRVALEGESAYPSDETARRGGPHETPVENAP